MGLGIDIGGTKVKVSCLQGHIVAGDGESDPYQRPDAPTLLKALRQAVERAGATHDATCVGLCVPGLRDGTGRRVTLSVNVPGLVGLDLDATIAQVLGKPVPVAILNDAHAAAHDLFVTQQLQGRLLAVVLGTGVGAAVLDDGLLLKVEGTSPGHLGQIDVSVGEHPPLGPDGGRGGLEAYIGVHALRRDYGEDFPQAVKHWTAASPQLRALARAIRISHALYRPDHIWLMGGIGWLLSPLLPTLRHLIDHELTSIARPGYTLNAASSLHHAARGAARLAESAPVA